METRTSIHTTDFEGQLAELVNEPSCLNELTILLKDLNDKRIPFHVVSRGQNWGYGDSSVNSCSTVLINLSKMNKILEFDCELGTLLIEPGVSQMQVSEFLNNQKDKRKWCLDVTGANQEASIVGNFLERGFGHTSHGDHELNGKVIEAVTVAGQILQPHQSLCSASKTRGLYQHDTGLNIEKLFYQTHFAIVTKYLVQLRPKYNRSTFGFILMKDSQLTDVILKMAHLKATGVINSIPHIANRLRLERSSKFKNPDVADWVLTVDISGPKKLAQLRKSELRKNFAGFKTAYMNSSLLTWINYIAKLVPFPGWIIQQIENLNSLSRLYSGRPVSAFVENSLKLNTNSPLKARWICPLVPSKVEDLNRVKEIIGSTAAIFGLELPSTVSMLNSKCVVWVSEITAHSDIESEIINAQACYDALEKSLHHAGYPFYRYGLSSGKKIYSLDSDSKFAKDIYLLLKKQFDPHNLLSRGRWGI